MSNNYKFRIANQKDMRFIYKFLKAMTIEEGMADRFIHSENSLNLLLFSKNPIAEVLLIEKKKYSLRFAYVL